LEECTLDAKSLLRKNQKGDRNMDTSNLAKKCPKCGKQHWIPKGKLVYHTVSGEPVREAVQKVIDIANKLGEEIGIWIPDGYKSIVKIKPGEKHDIEAIVKDIGERLIFSPAFTRDRF